MVNLRFGKYGVKYSAPAWVVYEQDGERERNKSWFSNIEGAVEEVLRQNISDSEATSLHSLKTTIKQAKDRLCKRIREIKQALEVQK